LNLDDAGSPIDFGPVAPEVERLLAAGVVAYRRDRPAAERLFQEAQRLFPKELPVYFCLYKIHAYQGNLQAALTAVESGLAEAARQAGWIADPERWPAPVTDLAGPGRFALYTLKALAFVRLKRGERAAARAALRSLARLDPKASVGWNVIAALADGSN
jgi:hypothetical protein